MAAGQGKPQEQRVTLQTKNLSLSYEERQVIRDLDLSIPDGKVSVIVGANGCGKSTLLRGLSRLLKPQGGTVVLDGTAIHEWKTKDVAKRLGILPQSPVAPDGLTVMDLVNRGRSPHQSWWRQWSTEDENAVAEALAATRMTEFAERAVDELSGGQRQRAWISMAIAQQTSLLLLDEPTTHLDLAHQIDVLDLVLDLNRGQGRTVVMVLHDLNQACRYADNVIALKDGKALAQGLPADVITAELVREVFDLRSQVITDPISGTPLILPFGKYHTGKETHVNA
ncbi:ABC transporter ATP-binding protein [Pseudonocardiaceae bacterium YIM PH 21723]|nr:ABC transporter ATP-binding protein [Pseudonocardiaceae bacterium YIM PH 21723]